MMATLPIQRVWTLYSEVGDAFVLVLVLFLGVKTLRDEISS